MKKKLCIFLAAVASISCAAAISACGHTHTYSDKWSSDETYHWHAATCYHDDIDPIEKSEHTFDDGKIIKAATHTEDGEIKYTCTVCSYSYTVVIPKESDAHTFATEWSNNANKHWHAATCGHDLKSDEADHEWNIKVTKEPTHTSTGEKTYTCKVCKYQYTETIPANDTTGHTFATEWSNNANKHWHAATCGHDLKSDEADHEWEEKVTKEPTHTTAGEKTYTCKVCKYQYTETIPANDTTGHTFATDWSKDETKHWHTATCGHDLKYDEADHDFKEEITKPATATEKGIKTLTCKTCGYQKTEEIPATGEEHKHTFATDWSKDESKHWHTATCGHDLKADEADHDFKEEITKPATATEKGIKTLTCKTCGYQKTEEIPATGEEHKHTFATDWSSDADMHWHASTCEHDVIADEAYHSFDKGVIVKAPTETERGVISYTCTVCGKTRIGYIPATGDTHEHIYSNLWTFDASGHWHDALCGHNTTTEKELHVYDKTAENPNRCTVCGYVRPTPVTDETDLIAALQNGETVKLENDIEVTGTIELNGVSPILDLNGHIIDAKVDPYSSAISVTGGKLTLKDSAGNGEIKSDNYGIYVLDGGSLVIENGNVSAIYSALTSNNTTELANFTIKGGTITAEQGPAIYFPSQGTLTIEGGSFYGGIVARMGQISISGGEFIAPTDNLDKIQDYYSYSGNVYLGGALTIFGGTYTAKDADLKNSLNLNITGGKFVNKNTGKDEQFQNAITVYVCGKVEQEFNVNIKGATFDIANGKQIKFVDPADLVGDGYKSAYKTYTNVVKFNGELIAFNHKTLKKAMELAQPSDVIAICEDITLTDKVPNGNKTVDGIYFDTANNVVIKGEGHTLTGAVVVNSDGITLRNIVFANSNDNGLNIYGAQNVKIENVTVEGYAKCGIAINGSSVTVSDSTIAKSDNNSAGWAQHYDIGIMYNVNAEVNKTASVLTVGANNNFENGTIYSERTAEDKDTYTFENFEDEAKWTYLPAANGSWALVSMSDSLSYDAANNKYTVKSTEGFKALATVAFTKDSKIFIDTDLDFTDVKGTVDIANFSGEIDFNGHTVKGLTLDNCANVFANAYGGLIYKAKDATIKNLNYVIADLGTDVSVRPVMYVYGNTTFENVSVSGTVTYNDNNTSVFAYKVAASNSTLTFENCTNYAVINNKGGNTGIFLGKVDDTIKDMENIKLVFSNCKNYGTVYSIGNVAMLISNACTFQNVDVNNVIVTDCVNYGNLYAGSGKNANLFVGGAWKSGKGITQEQIKSFETAGKVENGENGLSMVFTNFKTLTTEDNKYKLEAADGASYYYLTFSFWVKALDEEGNAVDWGFKDLTLKFTSLENISVDALAFKTVQEIGEATKTEITIGENKVFKTTMDGTEYYVVDFEKFNTIGTPSITFTAYNESGIPLSIAK